MKKFGAIAALCMNGFPLNECWAYSLENVTNWDPTPLKIEFATRISVKLEDKHLSFDKVNSLGERRIISISGGKMEGPLLNGEVLNQGTEWEFKQADGTTLIETRYILKTDDGALIYVSTKGLKWTLPEIVAAKEDKTVHPDKYYFRQYLFFETSAPPYAWLNRTLAVDTIKNSQGGDVLIHDIYLVR